MDHLLFLQFGCPANVMITKYLLPCAEDGLETTNDDGPENNPQYTTVYVGNLAPEASKPTILPIFVIFFVICLLKVLLHPGLQFSCEWMAHKGALTL